MHTSHSPAQYVAQSFQDYRAVSRAIRHIVDVSAGGKNMEFYQSMIDAELAGEYSQYQDIPPRDSQREPKRSRIQLDVSAETRASLGRYALSLDKNPKQIILEAIAEKHPALADELLAEIKNRNHTTHKYYGDKT